MSLDNLDPDIAELIGDAPAKDAAFTGGAYEGASRFDNSVALWSPSLRSADMDILPEKDIADARTRDILRNDAYMAGGAALHRDNIVGSMFVLSAKPVASVLGLDDTWMAEFQEEVEEKFTLWAESPNNWVDASRMSSFTGLIRLATGIYVAGGEVLATAEWIRDNDRPYKTAIQMLELERLSTPPDRGMDKTIRGGVQRDKYGAPIGYHIRKAHPSEIFDADAWAWKYVPARKPWGRMQVIHILEQTRPDQTRGISDMVTALSEMQMTKRFRKIVLQNAVVNATYAASIESDLPSEAAFAAIGGGDTGSAVAQYATNYLGAIASYVGNSRNLHLDGVKIPHLFPGTRLQLRPAGTPGGVGQDFESSLLRYLAANLGVSYEQLSKDYSKTNYSSARAGMVETWKFMQSRKKMVAERMANLIYRLWLEEAMNKKEITSLSKKAPSWYEGMNADAYSNAEWIGAGRGQVDELKETQASILRLKSNLSTWEDELAKQGKDWRKVFAQLEREKKDQDKRGLVLQEDNSINAASGDPREKTAAGASDGSGGDD